MKVKLPNLLSLLLLGIIIQSCSCKRNNIQEILFTPQLKSSIDSFSDSVFVSDMIRSIFYDNNNYYFLDNRSAVIICTDENLKFKTIIGRRGQGPGETVFLNSFGIFEDKIILNGSGASLNIFDKENGKFLSTFSYDRDVGVLMLSPQMIIEDNKIIACLSGKYILEDLPVVTLDFSGNIVATSKGTVTNIKSHSVRKIHKLKDGGFLSVVKTAPVIDVYGNNSNYIKSVDISSINIFKKTMKQQQENLHISNSMSLLIGDSYCTDNKLYLLCYSAEGNIYRSDTSCNTILEFDLSENAFTYSRTIILPDAWYVSICVTPDDKILTATNTFKATVEQFDLTMPAASIK
jgi:hypothetical protein